jgi:putative ABC transport system permease protein
VVNPLWAKSPLLLLRFPGLLLSVLAGALLLALAGASSPLFTSSAARSALASDLEETTVFGAGATIGQAGPFEGRPGFGPNTQAIGYRKQDEILRRSLGDVPNLGNRILTLLGDVAAVEKTGRESDPDEVRLLSRTEVLANVRRVRGREGGGVWVADTVAGRLGVAPGDTIRVSLPNHPRRVEVAVDGIYEALWKSPETTPYWRSLYGQIYTRNVDFPPPPTFLIASESLFKRLTRGLGQDHAQFRWEFPVEGDGLTMPEAEALERRLERFQTEINNPDSKLGQALFPQRMFRPRIAYDSAMSTVVASAKETVSGIQAPVELLSSAGSLVAIAVIAAAAAFAMARRRVEATLLYARGMSPFRIGLKAALESLLPVVVGTALGLAAAVVLVRLLGPGGAADSEALREAAKAVSLRLPVAVFLLGLVAGVVFLRRSERARVRFGRLNRVPWEIVPLVLAAIAFQRLSSHGAFVREGDEGVSQPSVWLLLFPIFFIAGFAGLAARLLQRPLNALRARADSLPSAPYLAVHRLAGARRLAILLVTACALALGTFVYAQTVVSSLEKTVVAKSLLFVGSDVHGVINYHQEAPRGFPYPVTKTTKVLRGGDLDGQQVDFMAIDTGSFAGAAYWDASWASRSVDELMRELRSTSGQTLPVLVAGEGALATDELELGGLRIPIRVVATTSAAPAMALGRPLIVADAALVERFADRAGVSNPLAAAGNDTELWAKGPTAAVASAFATSDTHPFPIVTAEEVRDNPSITAVTRTFGFLKSLGFGAGLLAVVGLVLYLQARQRSRIVSYALSRRMGLANGSHRLSLALELGVMLLAALAIGAVLAIAAAQLVLGDVDPLEDIPPAPLFSAPVALILAAGVALVGIALLGGLLANRAAERANFAEVMRLAD